MRNAISLPSILAAIVLFVGLGAYVGFQGTRAGEPSFVLWVGAPLVVLALAGVFRAYRDGILLDWFSVRGGDFTRGFVSAALLFGGAWAFAKTVTSMGSAREGWLVRLYLQLGNPAVLRAHVGWVVLGIVVLAVAEEVVWRGLVPLLLEERLGTRRAWVWSAVLYAVAQLPTAIALRDPRAGWNPILPLAALAVGLVWGYMARRFERLLPSIFAHVLFDWTVVMMFPLWGL